jgi:HicA toxin of bacterial toxin-antitoxin,
MRKGTGKSQLLFSPPNASHIHIRRNEPFTQISVPDHKNVKKGTLRSIIRQSGLSVDEFLALL